MIKIKEESTIISNLIKAALYTCMSYCIFDESTLIFICEKFSILLFASKLSACSLRFEAFK